MFRNVFPSNGSGNGRSSTSQHPNNRQSRLHLETLEDRTLLSTSPIGNLVVFGDSLADAGNVYLATGGTTPNPAIYSQGHFTNGPIWVDTLAKYMNQPAVKPSLAGGLDFAFGGATVAFNSTTVPMLGQQVDLYLSGHTPASNDLFAIWAGANDFFDTFTSANGPISPIQSADALESSLTTLVTAGARRFVVANLPPLGETPFIQGLGIPGLSTAADEWTSAFNAELQSDLSNLQSDHSGVTAVLVDVAGLFQQIVHSPSTYGFVNTTNAVGPLIPESAFLSSVTATCSQNYLFFDGVHPTTKGHQLVGLEAAADVDAALGIHNLVVTSTADTVNPLATGLSLREEVNLADALPGVNTISFNLGLHPQPIKLRGTDLALTSDIVIDGPNNDALSISGRGMSRIFDVGPDAIVTLSHLTLTAGEATTGGAISNGGHLQLLDVRLTGNRAQVGAGVYNAGVLTVADSQLNYNTATGGRVNAGGALANAGSSAVALLFNSVFLGNSASGGALAEGGGIANFGGAQLSVLSCLMESNAAYGVDAWGGAIFNGTASSLLLDSSRLMLNKAFGIRWQGGYGLGGGLYLAAHSTFERIASLIEGNTVSTSGPNVYKAS